jgi:hypothetical protein
MGRRIAIAAPLLLGIGATSASAATLRVCPHGCAYSQVADAHDGDTVSVAAGNYPGGFAITKSVMVDRAGAGRTVISGGGPVITVGTLDGSSEPTVIREVTITGGVTHSAFGTSFEALGGGVYVPEAPDGATPTTLTIIASAITGNTAAPTSEIQCPSGAPCGAIGICPFAHAGGGGIDSWGNLTVRNTLVAGNRANGPFTSDADGGGIYSQNGTLTVEHSVITQNEALAGIPDGRFAEGAGIMVDNFFSEPGTCVSPRPLCQFVLRDSVVDGNTSRLETTLRLFSSDYGGPSVIGTDLLTVRNSTISRNFALARSDTGSAEVLGGGVFNNTPLTLDHVTVSHNTARAVGPDGVAQGGAIWNGHLFAGPPVLTIKNSSVVGNTLEASPGIPRQGGGIFTTFPIGRLNTARASEASTARK